MKIAPGCEVEITFELFDAAGELVESSEEIGSVVYTHGADELVPGLEAALLGKSAGDRLDVSLEPDEAFGPYDAELIVSVPRAELPPDAEIVPGDIVPVVLEEEEGDDALSAEDREMEMRVVEIGPDAVFLDANPPLAGQKVRFQVEVLKVTPSEGAAS